jgi:hypothetical protein
MKKRKIDILLDCIRKGDKPNSIKLVSSFNRGVTKEEMRIIEIAAECYKGLENFYKELGYDIEEYKEKAWRAIIKNYSNQL